MVSAYALSWAGFAVTAEVERVAERELPFEAALARAAARGDKAAFARLVDRHQRAVLGLCLRLLGDREEARDAAQESFVRAWTAIAAFDAAQPFAPWVLRIARNHCFDLARRQVPRSRMVELDAPASDGAPGAELADAGEGADARLEHAQRAASIDLAVAALPPNYREVIQLFHVEHMSYKDIAAVMGVPIGTVMTWLHRARAKLRAALAPRKDRP